MKSSEAKRMGLSEITVSGLETMEKLGLEYDIDSFLACIGLPPWSEMDEIERMDWYLSIPDDLKPSDY